VYVTALDVVVFLVWGWNRFDLGSGEQRKTVQPVASMQCVHFLVKTSSNLTIYGQRDRWRCVRATENKATDIPKKSEGKCAKEPRKRGFGKLS
jgi:hypothetical protein